MLKKSQKFSNFPKVSINKIKSELFQLWTIIEIYIDPKFSST